MKQQTATQKAAFESVKPHRESLQEHVLAVLRENRDGLTQEEIIHAVQRRIGRDVLDHSIRPRVAELARQKLAKKTDETRPSSTGREQIVWRAVIAPVVLPQEELFS